MAPSILRNKDKSQATGKRNVSFSQGVSVSNKKAKPSTRLSHDDGDEEDAFDPTEDQMVDDEDNWRKSEEKQIRQARSTRESRRAVSSDLSKSLDDDCGVMYSNLGERLSGEEEVDKHLSLVHDNDMRNGNESDKMQCPIEPFNLKSEREDGSGYFEGDTYVFRKRQIEGEEDAWLDNLKSEDEEAGGDTASRNSISVDNYITKRQKKNNNGSINDNLDENMTKEQIYEQYVPLLGADTETVMKALSRYGKVIKIEKKLNNNNKTKEEKYRIATPNQDKHSASHTALNRITELANFCMMNFADGGNIYERDKKYFVNFLEKSKSECKKEGGASYFTTKNGSVNEQDDTSNPANVTNLACKSNAKKRIQWEYRGNQDNAIHGPYSTQQMVDWTSAGYFLGEMAVDIRLVSNEENLSARANNKDDDAQATKQDAVDDLLGDFDDDDKEENTSENNAEWMRSDSVNFSSYL